MNATARVFGQSKAREAPSRSDFGAGAPTRRMAAWAAGPSGLPAETRRSLTMLWNPSHADCDLESSAPVAAAAGA
jgi:hypothetical protein